MATSTLLALACWPAWLYLLQRWVDGSDEPLGLLAAASLLWLSRTPVRQSKPAGPWLVGLLAYGGLRPYAPPMLSSALALLLLAAALSQARHGRILPGWLGLALLSLPSLASLQFFLGYPARLSAACAAQNLLSLEGFPIQLQGLVLQWGQQRLSVDPPCSGLAGLWMLLFYTMLLASQRRWNLPRTLTMAGLAVAVAWAANVLRLSGLFFSELVLHRPELHQPVGLVTFLLGLASLHHLAPPPQDPQNQSQPQTPSPEAAPPPAPLILLLAASGLFSAPPPAPPAFPGWPRQWQGRPLHIAQEVTLPGFPGRIARCHTPQGPLLLRWVNRPTRLLHSSADCYRAAGLPFQGEETIYDADGRRFHDVSQWYWAASFGTSRGPWIAETTSAKQPRP